MIQLEKFSRRSKRTLEQESQGTVMEQRTAGTTVEAGEPLGQLESRHQLQQGRGVTVFPQQSAGKIVAVTERQRGVGAEVWSVAGQW